MRKFSLYETQPSSNLKSASILKSTPLAIYGVGQNHHFVNNDLKAILYYCATFSLRVLVLEQQDKTLNIIHNYCR